MLGSAGSRVMPKALGAQPRGARPRDGWHGTHETRHRVVVVVVVSAASPVGISRWEKMNRIKGEKYAGGDPCAAVVSGVSLSNGDD